MLLTSLYPFLGAALLPLLVLAQEDEPSLPFASLHQYCSRLNGTVRRPLPLSSLEN